ncbi:MAG: methylenetetrahydrofolate--tRNA-(uracil(54)-C(5))-methyltransferase (FADH(2)-oxidizing) TrmFO [Clostridia bacterium]|nr:methylenetetrahydrofolate--tRNA-(uracil(54)-C(5))-methyltransferase (FADH(2)-oxidizing) TrmFO [Clostridia bacterium]
MKLSVIGAGLAGCEAAFAAAERGISVTLYEMKPQRFSPAHTSSLFAELVCSNSLKAARLDSAAGLLKAEMRSLGSVCLRAADGCTVPAGGALAVDRQRFSEAVTEAVRKHPNITVVEQEITDIPEGTVIVATGPLTDGALAESIAALCGTEYLRFYDAAAPIVSAESVDMQKAFAASRYDKGEADYINCPFNKEEYERFHAALVAAETAPLHGFDHAPKVYEGCMPIEVLAKRGTDAIRFGPMKPVGLRDPRTGHRPWAVVQLRKENTEATMYNLVGFQTNLKFGEQKRVFSMIPGLEKAEFLRYGVMHRNSFLNSPALLNPILSLKKEPRIYFAGQITGMEGYMESAAAGLVAGINAANALLGQQEFMPPETTMIGALCRYVAQSTAKDFQPMGANFGILPGLDTKIKDKRARYMALAQRAMQFYEMRG